MKWRSLHRLLLLSFCSLIFEGLFLADLHRLLLAEQLSNQSRRSEARYDSLASWSDGFLKIRVEKHQLSLGYRVRFETGSGQGRSPSTLEVQSTGSVSLTGGATKRRSNLHLDSGLAGGLDKQNIIFLDLSNHTVRNRGNLRLGLDELITGISITPTQSGTIVLCHLSSSHRFEAYWDNSANTLWIESATAPSPKFAPVIRSASRIPHRSSLPPEVVTVRHLKVALQTPSNQSHVDDMSESKKTKDSSKTGGKGQLESVEPEKPSEQKRIQLIQADILEPELPPTESKEEQDEKGARVAYQSNAQSLETPAKMEHPLLRGIELDRDDHSALVFSMSAWPEYRLRKVQDGLFYLKILDAKVSDNALLLPRFAPSSNTALKMVTAKLEKDGLSVEIYTESGIELSSKVVGDDIWLEY